MNELEVFTAALELADSAARSRFLDEACGGRPELRARIEALLQNVTDGSHCLESPAENMLHVALAGLITERSGTQIGPYKLLQVIGEGGMGVVYMAEQTEPVKRQVALKLIKPGMDSHQVIARFEAERQALAMMDHVNIARVLDAGTIGFSIDDFRFSIDGKQPEQSAIENRKSKIENSGRPYFVMELIHGVPITKYCDDNQLTPRERLDLFVPVCQAIQHAHQKGIIHRDIKPSNVMITQYDGKPIPKVIDFGVAKATEQRLTERTLFTQHGTMVGTLEYMSNLAAMYHDGGKFDLARPLLEEALEKLTATLGPNHHTTLNCMNNLATLYRDDDRLGEAEPLFLDAVTGARHKLGLEHSFTQTYLRNLADCCDRLRQPEKAEPLWRELVSYWKEKAGADSLRYAAELHPLGASLLAQSKHTEAESLLRECAAIREKNEPDAWGTFCTRSVLGGCLLGQQKYAEAEPLLLASHEGLKQVEARTPQRDGNLRVRESLERLVQLYEATGNQDKAAEWRQKLEELKTRITSQKSEKGKP